MLVETMTVGFVQTNCYLAYHEITREGFLVDPGDNAPRIIDTINRLHIQVKYIFLTHSHFDHIMALADVSASTGQRLPFMRARRMGLQTLTLRLLEPWVFRLSR